MLFAAPLLHVSLQQQSHFSGCLYFLITFGALAEQSNRNRTGAKANNQVPINAKYMFDQI